jgi:hypothetical protein
MTMETEDEQVWKSDLSCTFCGPGAWATWEVVTDDGVLFVCDKHHVDMSEAKSIGLERRMGGEAWTEINERWEIPNEEKYLNKWIEGF